MHDRFLKQVGSLLRVLRLIALQKPFKQFLLTPEFKSSMIRILSQLLRYTSTPLFRSQSYETDSLETRAEMALLRAYVENTKLYQNPFFFIGHQNVNKPKSRAARTFYGLIFLPLYKIIVRFFLFYVKMQIKQDQTVL